MGSMEARPPTMNVTAGVTARMVCSLGFQTFSPLAAWATGRFCGEAAETLCGNQSWWKTANAAP